MSGEEQQEWKTIRVSAISYYKLSEISGFLSIISGTPFSLSTTADLVIQGFYNNSHQSMLRTISDPKEIQRIREQWKGHYDEFMKLIKPLVGGREK